MSGPDVRAAVRPDMRSSVSACAYLVLVIREVAVEDRLSLPDIEGGKQCMVYVSPIWQTTFLTRQVRLVKVYLPRVGRVGAIPLPDRNGPERRDEDRVAPHRERLHVRLQDGVVEEAADHVARDRVLHLERVDVDVEGVEVVHVGREGPLRGRLGIDRLRDVPHVEGLVVDDELRRRRLRQIREDLRASRAALIRRPVARRFVIQWPVAQLPVVR